MNYCSALNYFFSVNVRKCAKAMIDSIIALNSRVKHPARGKACGGSVRFQLGNREIGSSILRKVDDYRFI